MRTLRELIEVLPMLGEPVGCGAASDWRSIEQRWQVLFPSDYQEFVSVFGGGGVHNYLGILSPFCSRSDLFDFNFANRWFYLRCTRDQEIHFFPDQGGLLAFAADEDGNTAFWETGNGGRCGAVRYYSFEMTEYESFASFTDFVFDVSTFRSVPDFMVNYRTTSDGNLGFWPDRWG